MKLYEIPRESKIKLDVVTRKKVKKVTITFHRTDGMYSYCTVDGMPDDGKNVVHLSVSTPLIKRKGYYEIDLNANSHK